MDSTQPGPAAPRARHARTHAHVVEMLEERLCLAAGAPDKSFGGDGTVFTKFTGPNDDYATAVAVQHDGKAVVVGRTVGAGGAGGSQFLLTRFNANGTLDKSFGNGGVVRSSYDFANDSGGFGAADVAIQNDRKIVIAGYFGPDFAAARFNPDGSIDKKFADGGVFRIQAHRTGSSFAGSLAVRPDGRIVLGGQARVGAGGGSNIDSVLVRLTKRGTLDKSFGDGGIVRHDLGAGDDDRIHDLALDADRRIVVAGAVEFGERSQAVLARFSEDGSIDDPFGSDGKVFWGADSVADHAAAVLVLDGGRIIATGGSGGDAAVHAYRHDGSPDTDFADQGRILTDLGSSSDAAVDVVAGADDSFFVLASKGDPLDPDGGFAVLKYTHDGDRDTSFGIDGLATAAIVAPAQLSGIALAENDSLVLAGNDPYDWATQEDIVVARLGADGAPDPGFSHDGVATAGATAPQFAQVLAAETLDGGNVLALGRVRYVTGEALVLARYGADGALNRSFGRRGRVTLLGLSYENATAMTVAPDGRIVIAAMAQNPEFGEVLAVMRLNADGSPDESFGADGTVVLEHVNVYPADVEVHSDGGIVVGGSDGQGMFSTFGLVRFGADGTFDTAFGDSGVARANFKNNIDGVTDMVIQPDGRIIAVGRSVRFTMPGEEWPVVAGVARFNPDGSPDKSFSGNGKVALSGGGAVAAHVNPKRGKILVLTGGGKLVRLTRDGMLDPKFGRNGRVRLDLDRATVGNAAFDSRGDLVVLGNTYNDDLEVTGTILTRFTRTGARDASFGDDGAVPTRFSGAAIAIDEEADRLLFGGERNGRFAVARYLLD